MDLPGGDAEDSRPDGASVDPEDASSRDTAQFEQLDNDILEHTSGNITSIDNESNPPSLKHDEQEDESRGSYVEGGANYASEPNGEDFGAEDAGFEPDDNCEPSAPDDSQDEVNSGCLDRSASPTMNMEDLNEMHFPDRVVEGASIEEPMSVGTNEDADSRQSYMESEEQRAAEDQQREEVPDRDDLDVNSYNSRASPDKQPHSSEDSREEGAAAPYSKPEPTKFSEDLEDISNDSKMSGGHNFDDGSLEFTNKIDPYRTNLDEQELDYEEEMPEDTVKVSGNSASELSASPAGGGSFDFKRKSSTDTPVKKESSQGNEEGECDDDDDLEEGEVKEPKDAPKEALYHPSSRPDFKPRLDIPPPQRPDQPPICRFFLRGSCSWGLNCRFIHQGVGDRGPGFGGAPYAPPILVPPITRPLGAQWEIRRPVMPPYSRERVPPSPPLPSHAPQVEEVPVESAWEKGLRQAKEILKRANKRKETEPDFEEKRMNQTLAADDFEKENEAHYTRKVEPYYDYEDPMMDPYSKPHHIRSGSYENLEIRHVREDYDHRVKAKHHRQYRQFVEEDPTEFKMRRERHVHRAGGDKPPHIAIGASPPGMMAQRATGSPVPGGKPIAKTRGDEWKDPWRRSVSPKGRGKGGAGGPTRNRSYSSGSSGSYSSSRSTGSSYSSYSRSSSGSSYSSYSRSRSRSPSGRKRPPPAPGTRPPNRKEQGQPRRKPPPIASPKQGPQGPVVTRIPPPLGAPPPTIERKFSGPPPKQVSPTKPPAERLSRPANRPRGGSFSGSESGSSSGSSRSSSGSASPRRNGAKQPQQQPGGHGRGQPTQPGHGPRDRVPSGGRPQQDRGAFRDQRSQQSAGGAPRGGGGDPKSSIKLNLVNKPNNDPKSTDRRGRDSRDNRDNRPRSDNRGSVKSPAGGSQQANKNAPFKIPTIKPNPSLGSAPADSKPAGRSGGAGGQQNPSVKKPDIQGGRKRQASPTPPKGDKMGVKPTEKSPLKKKSTSSRRDELLKQLKAVEDAIARKRSKLN